MITTASIAGVIAEIAMRFDGIRCSGWNARGSFALVGAALFGGGLFEVRDRAFPAPTTLSTSQLNTTPPQRRR